MDLAGHGFEQVLQELPGRLSIRRFHELGDGELGRPRDADERMMPPLSGSHLGNVPSRGLQTNRCRAADVEEAPFR